VLVIADLLLSLLFSSPSEGRSGAPKRRLLYCNPEVTELYWSDRIEDGPVFPPKKNRTIVLGKVAELRKGTETDPENIPKLGTRTLRRKCRAEDMHLCFSLVLNKRTFDIQCNDRAELELIFGNLSQHLVDQRSSESGACSNTSDDDCYSETSEVVSMAGSDEGGASEHKKVADRSNSIFALEGNDEGDELAAESRDSYAVDSKEPPSAEQSADGAGDVSEDVTSPAPAEQSADGAGDVSEDVTSPAPAEQSADGAGDVSEDVTSPAPAEQTSAPTAAEESS
jgi:hypothetical protein